MKQISSYSEEKYKSSKNKKQVQKNENRFSYRRSFSEKAN